ncbi:cysteine desulfurase [Polycladomyces abyssicola]|uniref:cysteine desulfurase n=1 Tax=Polycladomyces abyssicola TaxID=1125966 RepID=A0A8D5ZQK0_9BACL|nr:aminotransferase class V-fold PLP-dependent enzyme [Polycladomyces abyssicola]BCU83403.1 cysteine desulfurase [Polycladomyces abyssicola]
MIYLDNAATTWPKPEGVSQAVKDCIDMLGANPGRGGHRLSVQAGEVLAKARRSLADLFGIRDPQNLFFYANATQAINQALKGLLQPGDHVVISPWEHNAMARPLETLKKECGIRVTVVPPSPQGTVDPLAVEEALTPDTRLIAMTHGSNVTGAVLPIEEIGAIAAKHGVLLLVDAAQTAGVLPIDVETMNIDLLAFPGHKGLFGPQGTGGLYVHPDVKLEPWIQGGTGSRSESLDHPSARPDGFESGTPNTPGIAGLEAGVRFVTQTGLDTIHRKEMALNDRLRSGLQEMDGVRVYGPEDSSLPVTSFNLEGVDSLTVAGILDQHFEIAVRAGFHCAALAHRSLGTDKTGTVRVSPGYFNCEKEIDDLLAALREIREVLL